MPEARCVSGTIAFSCACASAGRDWGDADMDQERVAWAAPLCAVRCRLLGSNCDVSIFDPQLQQICSAAASGIAIPA
jgi:hypothetical protein